MSNSLKIEAYRTSSSLVPSNIQYNDNLEIIILRLTVPENSQTYKELHRINYLEDIFNDSNKQFVGGSVEFSDDTNVNVEIGTDDSSPNANNLLDNGIYQAGIKYPLKATFENPVPVKLIYIYRDPSFQENILTFRLILKK